MPDVRASTASGMVFVSYSDNVPGVFPGFFSVGKRLVITPDGRYPAYHQEAVADAWLGRVDTSSFYAIIIKILDCLKMDS